MHLVVTLAEQQSYMRPYYKLLLFTLEDFVSDEGNVGVSSGLPFPNAFHHD